MRTIFQRLGFKFTTLGTPLTEAEIDTNRRLYRRCCLASVLLAVLSVLALSAQHGVLAKRVVDAGLLETAVTTGALLMLLSSFLFGMATDLMLQGHTASRPIGGAECLKVKAAADTYPEVRQHIDAILQQGRQIRACDEKLIRDWVSEESDREWQRKADQACRSLHGIEVVTTEDRA